MSESPRGQDLQVFISQDDPRPMYIQLESQLRDLILDGILKPGTRLPSTRALAEETGCSVITTRRVYKDLEQDGFVRTRSGRGTVVVEIPEEEAAAYLRAPFEEAAGETVRAGLRAGLTEEEILRFFKGTLQREGASDGGGPQ